MYGRTTIRRGLAGRAYKAVHYQAEPGNEEDGKVRPFPYSTFLGGVKSAMNNWAGWRPSRVEVHMIF